MPDAEFLKSTQFSRIELHYGQCGNPSEYVADRVEFVCQGPFMINWWVEPLGAQSPEEREFVHLYVHFRDQWAT